MLPVRVSRMASAKVYMSEGVPNTPGLAMLSGAWLAKMSSSWVAMYRPSGPSRLQSPNPSSSASPLPRISVFPRRHKVGCFEEPTSTLGTWRDVAVDVAQCVQVGQRRQQVAAELVQPSTGVDATHDGPLG